MTSPRLLAAPGDLDPAFGGTGKVTTSFGGLGAYANSMVLQKDGKLVVVGRFYRSGQSPTQTFEDFAFALVRYKVDGSLDTDFGSQGKVITDFDATSGDDAVSVALQSDGKIVVAGTHFGIPAYPRSFNESVGLARYNPNGSLDTSFNTTGKVMTHVRSNTDDRAIAMSMQSDGKIVILERSRVELAPPNGPVGFFLFRYNANGSLDTGFDGDGMLFVEPSELSFGVENLTCLAIQSDGKYVLAGNKANNVLLKRFTPDGNLDPSFGTGGTVITQSASGFQQGANCIVIQNDGNIVIGGYSIASANPPSRNFLLSRYMPIGLPDTSFNGTGTTAIQLLDADLIYGYAGDALAIQSDGKIIIKGVTGQQGSVGTTVVRCNPDGTPDATFGTTGQIVLDLGGVSYANVIVQPDGKIVFAGYSDQAPPAAFAVVRLQGDPDTDMDGLADIYETGTGVYVNAMNTGSSPTNTDSDGDGIPDGQEVRHTHTNPNVADTDGDGFDDLFEINTGFNPTSPTSTPDAVSSIRTAVEFRFNAADGVSYRIESSTDLMNWVTTEPTIIGAGAVVTRFYSTEGQPRRYFRPRRN